MDRSSGELRACGGQGRGPGREYRVADRPGQRFGRTVGGDDHPRVRVADEAGGGGERTHRVDATGEDRGESGKGPPDLRWRRPAVPRQRRQEAHVPTAGPEQRHREPFPVTRRNQAPRPSRQLFDREGQVGGAEGRQSAVGAGRLDVTRLLRAGEEGEGRVGQIRSGRRGVPGMVRVGQGQPCAVERDEPAQHGEHLLGATGKSERRRGDLRHVQIRDRVLRHERPPARLPARPGTTPTRAIGIPIWQASTCRPIGSSTDFRPRSGRAPLGDRRSERVDGGGRGWSSGSWSTSWRWSRRARSPAAAVHRPLCGATVGRGSRFTSEVRRARWCPFLGIPTDPGRPPGERAGRGNRAGAGNHVPSQALTPANPDHGIDAGRPMTTSAAVAASPHRWRPRQAHRGRRRRSAGIRRSLVVRRAGPFSRDVPRPVRGTVRHAAAATVPGISEEEFVARPGQRQTGAPRTAPRTQRRVRHPDDVVAVLARTVREVEAAVQRGRVTPAVRTKFQAVALLLREERARVRAPGTGSDANRTEQLKRLEGIATILATTAVRDAGLLALLAEDAVVSDAARALARDMLRAGGVEPPSEEAPQPEATAAPAAPERRVVPQSVISRQLANPFLAPDFSAVPQGAPRPRRLAGWDLLGPLLSSFERAGGGDSACMPLPVPSSLRAPHGLELMPHQAQLVAATAAGHRTFLLADEPGLGKTAQALLAAEAANAYPLLVVVPNVVKTNWAREAGRWTPHRSATVIHGNGETIDGFADIVVVNYEVLDRHVGWLGGFGFRGMVVDEAHFIKNKTSQRSQHVLELSERIRSRTARPLLMALTGTPLINDIEDFRAIWQFLGWIDDSKPLGELMDVLEETGLTAADPGFYTAARGAGGHGKPRPPPPHPRLHPPPPRFRNRPRPGPPPQGRRGRRHPRPP